MLQTRVIRLTLMAPDIVEAIPDGRQGPELTLARVLKLFPMDWGEQRQVLKSKGRDRALINLSSRSSAETCRGAAVQLLWK